MASICFVERRKFLVGRTARAIARLFGARRQQRAREASSVSSHLGQRSVGVLSGFLEARVGFLSRLYRGLDRFVFGLTDHPTGVGEPVGLADAGVALGGGAGRCVVALRSAEAG